MAVLTIARELGAIVGGEELTLCNLLKLQCISKTILEKRFADLGIEKDFLSRFDERKPGLVSTINNSAGYYWETLRTAVMQELLKDNIAVFGRGGNFLLHGLVDCLRVWFIAPESFRMRQLAKERSISENEALKLIRQSDSEKRKFCDYYYGQQWNDPANYDLVINTAAIDMESAADIIAPLLPAPVNDRRKQELKLLVQTQIIKHTLFSVPELQLIYPDVIVDADGTVTLKGSVPSAAAARRAAEVVAALPDVSAVNNELSVILNDIPNRLPPFIG